MNVELKCCNCGKKYEVIPSRQFKSKYCSKVCSNNAKKAENNVDCTYCKKQFYMKKFQLNRYTRTRGIYCSKSCKYNDLKIKMKGDLNHQYGLKGELNSSFKGKEILKKNGNNIDIRIYKPEHPLSDVNGRVLKHRLLVEENYHQFDADFFFFENGIYYLKKEYDVHHIDNNHNNNDILNLLPVTKSEHTKIHNKHKIIIRDKFGKITGVIKSCELLETPEEDNQQPSITEM